MNRFEGTRFWQSTLAAQLEPDPEAHLREKLRKALDSFRERAKMLAGEIARDLPDFTVHDITHIDALWEMAQLIAGSDFHLTPTEAFVLGGAFLVHDLGMGLAAYPEGTSNLQPEPLWLDTVAALLKRQLGQVATEEEMRAPGKEIVDEANRVVLRELHAKHAERLALVSWEDPKNSYVCSVAKIREKW